MIKALRLRFLFIIFIIFMALFWKQGKIQTNIQTGVCENFDYEKWVCISGFNLRTVPFFMQLFNAETFIVVFGLTILGSWFSKGNLTNKIERASHMAKDAGELAATIGAVISFSGIFFEPSLHITFQYIFLAYLYGNLLGYLLTVISNYIRSEEESANALDQSSVTQ
mgnify:FL=1|jgi:hypothetical protein